MTPIKFVEALSFGLPILSTNINFRDSSIKNFIEFKNESEEHIEYITNFHNNESASKRNKRMNLVKDRSWDVTINQFQKILESDK